MTFEIILTDPFKKKLKKLKKKYSHIKEDLEPLLASLEDGEISGDPVPGLFGKVYKVRCASSDMKRGKSGGYRVIYYLELENKFIYLLTIYAKARQENITVSGVLEILRELDLKQKSSR